MPRNPKTPPPHLQPVEDSIWRLDIPEEQKPAVMAERDLTGLAHRQLGAPIHYCLPRGDKPLPDDQDEELHKTDETLRTWIDDVNKQGLNSILFLQNGVVEARFFGPDQSLNACFFAACAKVGIPARYAIGRRSREIATSILFKLRDDEAKRLDDEYAGFKPKPFTLDGGRRGVILNYASPIKKGSSALPASTLAPGSLLWHENGVDYDLFVWRDESGQRPAGRWQTASPLIDFFQIVRAAAYAAILNIVTVKAWEGYAERRSFSEWLARVVRDGTAINANVAFSKASRAIIADPKHAEDLIALICENKAPNAEVEKQRAECLEMFQFARKRLEADSARQDVAGWSIIAERFGAEAQKALRSVLNVGADSTLLEDFADRYLFYRNRSEFIDRVAFHEGEGFIFSKDDLALRHAPDQIMTRKKPVEAFPLFVKSKLRQEITDVETYPDHKPGMIIRVTREGAIIPDNDFVPEHSRLIFNDWRGLYIRPIKTIDAALRIECNEKLDQMLSLVTNHKKPRADWIKAHIGWTLKHPGKKQQVALVCTGDQGTGKTFLCTTFAQAVFGKYADTASVRALGGQFYIAGYIGKLWVSHDEFVSNFDNAEILKTLIRGVRVSGEIKGRDTATYTIFARLAFTSNEANPGISRGHNDRGLFQVTSISPASEGMLPAEFQDHIRREIAPFYEAYAAFLERDDVRQTYVRMLIDHAPAKMSEVEDLTHSAMRDVEVARKHLTDKQLVAKTILEDGTIHGDQDVAMPFEMSHLYTRANQVANSMSMRRVTGEDVLSEYIAAGLIERPAEGRPYLFKYKIGALQRLYGDYLGVPLHSRWLLDRNDDMPNDYQGGDPITPWKGRDK